MMQGENQPTIQFNLTPLKQRHQDLFCALYSDARVMAFIGAPMSRAAVADYFQRLLKKTAQADSGIVYRVIEVTADQDVPQDVGFVRLAKDNIEAKKKATRIGTMLLTDFQGLGLAYQAQKIIMAEQSDPGQIFTAYCHRDNYCAHRLYQRLGFHNVRELIYHQHPVIQWQREIICRKSKAV